MIKNRKGFTIVELSVVLVIIGLLVGAILGGQEVIESSKRMTIISNFSDHKAAYDQFKEKYYGMPGDLVDAASYWSTATNGDGNSSISAAEGLDAWQQLALAGFVDGTFTGTASGASSKALLDTDIPSSPYNNAGYTIFSTNTEISNTIPAVLLGRFRTGSTYDNGVLSPQQAITIDQKIDNNNPSVGQVITTAGNGVTSTNCVTSTIAAPTDSDNVYTLTTRNPDCIMYFYLEQVQE